MTTQLSRPGAVCLWADVPREPGVRPAGPLPAALEGAVRTTSPDPAAWALVDTSGAAAAEAFTQWRAGFCDTVLLGEQETAVVLAAWLGRRGVRPDFERSRTWDAAALSALAWRCDPDEGEVPASAPAALSRMCAEIIAVAAMARARGVSVTLRPAVVSYPTTSTGNLKTGATPAR